MSKIKPLYAIRQKSTGFFLPQTEGRGGRGSSWTEPTDPSTSFIGLYRSPVTAKRVLSRWLMGQHKADYSFESDETWGTIYRVQDGITIIPQPHRIKEDMEIVTINLVPEI